MSRADYRIVSFNDSFVTLRDLDLGGVSVTNDAEAIVREVAGYYPGRRILYHDSDCRLDELCHENGVFTGFAPYGGEA